MFRHLAQSLVDPSSSPAGYECHILAGSGSVPGEGSIFRFGVYFWNWVFGFISALGIVSGGCVMFSG